MEITVKELIKQLQSIENQEAKVGITYSDFSYMSYSDVAWVTDADDSLIQEDGAVYLLLTHPNMK